MELTVFYMKKICFKSVSRVSYPVVLSNLKNFMKRTYHYG